MAVTLSDSTYDALLYAALRGDVSEVRRVLQRVADDNATTRYRLHLQWVDADIRVPPRGVTSWPPVEREVLVLDRPIERADVTDFVSRRTARPVDILVTPDPDGVVGWTTIDHFFT